MLNYIIVEDYSLDDLVKQVNDKIKLGYVPCGSVIVTKYNNNQPFKFGQPMLKS